MSAVHNFILLGCCIDSLPDLSELAYENEPADKLPRWIRLTHRISGDGKAFEGDLFALVINGRDPQLVINAFVRHDWGSLGSATLMIKRENDDNWTVAARSEFA